ncbi:MAG: hypothetical protein A2V64_09795 [Bacteroidetes bacterium RBG_13_43_22]|nr:MAG: hypothetical protein A2V64_09795 [Bacteroidetes bacterium RBG_13_43_22]
MFIIFSVHAQKYELTSPDRILNAMIEIKQSVSVTLAKEAKYVVRLENISLETSRNDTENAEYKIQKVSRRSIDETVKPEIREKAASLANSYNELEIRFRNDQALTFRYRNGKIMQSAVPC